MKIELKNGTVRYVDTESVDDFSIMQLETLPQVPETPEITETLWAKAFMIRSGYFNDITDNLVMTSTFVPNNPLDYTYVLSSQSKSIAPIEIREHSGELPVVPCQPTGITDPTFGEIWMAGKDTYASEILGENLTDIIDAQFLPDCNGGLHILKLDVVYYAPAYGNGKLLSIPSEVLIVSHDGIPVNVSLGYTYSPEPHQRIYSLFFSAIHNIAKSVRGVYAMVGQDTDQTEINELDSVLTGRLEAEDYDFSFDLTEGTGSFSITPEKDSWVYYYFEWTDCLGNVKKYNFVNRKSLTYIDPFNGIGVHFPNGNNEIREITDDTARETIELRRLNTDGTHTVNITCTVTDDAGKEVSGVFTTPSYVTFDDGEDVVMINLDMDFSNTMPETTFHVTLSLPDEQECPEGPTTKPIKVKYTKWGPFQPYGDGLEMGVGNFSPFEVYDVEVPVYVAHSLVDNSRRFRFGDYDMDRYTGIYVLYGRNIILYHEDTPIQAEFAPGKEADRYYPAHMEPFEIGESSTGMISATDVHTLRTKLGIDIYQGNTDEELKNVSYYDSRTGKFTIYTICYRGSDPVCESREGFQLPGFTSDAAKAPSLRMQALRTDTSGKHTPEIIPAKFKQLNADELLKIKAKITADKIDL